MQGTFWLASAPQKSVRGEIECDSMRLTLSDQFLVDPLLRTQLGSDLYSFVPRNDHLERYLVHGRLDDGTELSLLQTIREDSLSEGQSFTGLVAVRGQLVAMSDLYTGATFSYRDPWSRLVAGAAWNEDIEVPALGRTQLRTCAKGVVAEWQEPTTLAEIQRRLVDPVTSLMMLLTRQRPYLDELRIVHTSGNEVAVLRRAIAPAIQSAPQPVAMPNQVGAAGLERWLTLTSKLNPLPMVVAKSIVGPGDVEPRVMALAACSEAFERMDHQNVVSRKQASQLRKLASEAVPEEFRELIEAQLRQVGDPTFSERLEALLSRLGHFADQIAGPITSGVEQGRGRWLKLVKDSRNGAAHMLPAKPPITDIDEYSGRMVVLQESLGWMMTALLLLHCGMPLDKTVAGVTSPSAWQLSRDRAIAYLPEIYAPLEANTEAAGD